MIVVCRRYYKKQDELISAYEGIHLDNTNLDSESMRTRLRRQASRLAKLSFFVNFVSRIRVIIFFTLSCLPHCSKVVCTWHTFCIHCDPLRLFTNDSGSPELIQTKKSDGSSDGTVPWKPSLTLDPILLQTSAYTAFVTGRL